MINLWLPQFNYSNHVFMVLFVIKSWCSYGSGTYKIVSSLWLLFVLCPDFQLGLEIVWPAVSLQSHSSESLWAWPFSAPAGIQCPAAAQLSPAHACPQHPRLCAFHSCTGKHHCCHTCIYWPHKANNWVKSAGHKYFLPGMNLFCMIYWKKTYNIFYDREFFFCSSVFMTNSTDKSCQL